MPGPLGVADDEIPYLFFTGDEPTGIATPTGEWTDLSAATIEFDARAQDIIDFAAQTDLDLRAYGARVLTSRARPGQSERVSMTREDVASEVRTASVLRLPVRRFQARLPCEP
jgi:hypothetical protein